MTEEFENHWRPAWDRQLRELAMTRHQLITLASIVESEVRYGPDREYVSAVYHNRLRRRMPLQADPTVIYAHGQRLPRVWEKHLRIRSPYNTYLHAGLPPGPISQPGAASVEAALFPKPVPYLSRGAVGRQARLLDDHAQHPRRSSDCEPAEVSADADAVRRRGAVPSPRISRARRSGLPRMLIGDAGGAGPRQLGGPAAVTPPVITGILGGACASREPGHPGATAASGPSRSRCSSSPRASAHAIGLGGRPHRNAEQESAGHVRPHGVEGHVVLAQMRPGRARGERHVHPVVDDHGHGQRGDERSGEGRDLGGGRVLGTDLHHRRTTAHRPPADVDRVAPLEQDGIGDHHEAQRHDGKLSARRRGQGSAVMEVVVSARGAARWQRGHPWIYRTDVAREPAATGAGPGIATVLDRRGRFLGRALYSPASEIRLRLLTRDDVPIDGAWWRARIGAAVARREGIPATAWRAVHGEGDGLPSLVVDRYGPWAVAQLLSAGLEAARRDVIGAIRDVLQPDGLLLRHDTTVRRHENLPQDVETAFGDVPTTSRSWSTACAISRRCVPARRRAHSSTSGRTVGWRASTPRRAAGPWTASPITARSPCTSPPGRARCWRWTRARRRSLAARATPR
jgi:hypothetical protein